MSSTPEDNLPSALDELQGRVPPMYITKYNRYVDNVLNKINKILRNGYDPVNVRLHTVKSNKKPNKNKKSKQKNQKKNKKQRSDNSSESTKEEETTSVTETSAESTTFDAPTTIFSGDKSVTKHDESRAKTPQKKQKNKNKIRIDYFRVIKPFCSSCKIKNSQKNNSKQSKPRAKATLYGLASLKRKNDVQVNLMSTHNTIKSKFYIGPLTLKVEKEFGRGAKKEIRSATATTTEMMGKINLRINRGGSAMLHSIRVMQPNLLRIDNPDDHDKTREFVWKRSSHIAQIVSQKLTKAARSLMRSTPKKPAKKKPQATGGFFSFFG